MVTAINIKLQLTYSYMKVSLLLMNKMYETSLTLPNLINLEYKILTELQYCLTLITNSLLPIIYAIFTFNSGFKCKWVPITDNLKVKWFQVLFGNKS